MGMGSGLSMEPGPRSREKYARVYTRASKKDKAMSSAVTGQRADAWQPQLRPPAPKWRSSKARLEAFSGATCQCGKIQGSCLLLTGR